MKGTPHPSQFRFPPLHQPTPWETRVVGAIQDKTIATVYTGLSETYKSIGNHREFIENHKKHNVLIVVSDIFCELLINCWLKLVN